METIKPLEIPASHIAFANEVAALAEKNGIKGFTMEYEPDWHGEGSWDRRVRGKAKINYSSADGRGRPCRNLNITFDALIVHEIESNPESSN